MNLPDEMTAIAITTPGGPEVLQPVRQPLPQLAPDEVLIRVAAAGVNAPDLSQRRGQYDPPPGASPLPGLEVSGVIAALGPEVAGLAEGQPVVALCNGGGYAEYVAVPAGQVLPLPAGWSLIDGAALPETFFTVQQTLVMRAGLEAGMDVLIHGAGGGIGGTAIQVSRLFGARPIAVVSTPEKARYAESLGAAAVIEHQREDFVERTLQLTGGNGADRIIDMVGGDYLPRNIEAAARGGHIVLLASLSGDPSNVSAGKLVFKWLTVSGSTLRPQPPAVKAAIAESLRRSVWPGLADGRIRPPRIRRLALEEAAAAHAAMEQRGHYGKIVLATAFAEQGQGR
ncbi:MAG TPA: NAD(P)H-quinone oxidoreductase [Devosiaceae bacterium]|jgi:putative PIG3 family NAD(P)H quinone oxidoreductase|nr:NAD(P)H-quinone oxidoreductase [Devosiaceae bacterium]